MNERVNLAEVKESWDRESVLEMMDKHHPELPQTENNILEFAACLEKAGWNAMQENFLDYLDVEVEDSEWDGEGARLNEKERLLNWIHAWYERHQPGTGNADSMRRFYAQSPLRTMKDAVETMKQTDLGPPSQRT